MATIADQNALGSMLQRAEELRQNARQLQLMTIERKLNEIVDELATEWLEMRRGLRNGSLR